MIVRNLPDGIQEPLLECVLSQNLWTWKKNYDRSKLKGAFQRCIITVAVKRLKAEQER